MDKNPLSKGVLTENFIGIGTVTREMVQERAMELAVINGRSAQEVSKSDREQARRELTGEAEQDPKEAVLESASESQRWDPVYASTGEKAPESPNEDEDDEGRSQAAQLVEEGIREAEHDQMLHAAVEAEEEDA